MTGIITSLPPLIEQPPGNNASNPAGLPGLTYTPAVPTLPQTWTGLQTFMPGSVKFAGATSGNTFLNASTIASGTVFLPAVSISDTLVGQNTTDTLTNKALTNPTINGATISGTLTGGTYSGITIAGASTYNGNTWTTGTGTLTISAGKTLAASNTLTLAGTDSTTMTFPTTSATLARTDAGQTFTGANTFGNINVIGTGIVQSNNGIAFGVGPNGAANPAFLVDASTASQAAGLSVKGAVTGGTVSLAAIDSGSNTNLQVKSKGSGQITLQADTGNQTTVNIGVAGVSGATYTLAGSSSGALTFLSQSAASGTLTYPNGPDTLVGRATTDTLTNKSIVATQLTGTLQAAQFPALTSDVTTSAGSLATTIAANAVTNAKMATMAAWTFKANNTGSAATPTDITIDGLTVKASPVAGDEMIIWDVAGAALKKATVSSVASAGSVSSIAGNTGAFTLTGGITNTVNAIGLTAGRLTLPTIQRFTSGSALTYTTPANCLWIRIRMVGGGSGGSGSGTGQGTSSAGTASTWSGGSLSAGGGAASNAGSAGPLGGTATGGNVVNINGSAGSGATNLASETGETGGCSYFGGAGGGSLAGTAGGAAATNSGSGGGGSGSTVGSTGSSSGASGGYVEHIIGTPAATYTYTVGAKSAGGGGGTGGAAGGAGADGIIIVEEYYGS